MSLSSTSPSLRHGYELHQAGDLRGACVIYARALKLEPVNAQLLFAMGVAQQQLGDHDRALNFLGRAIKSQPDYPEALLHRGISLANKGQMGMAIQAYRQATALKPDYFEAHFNLGNALTTTHKRHEAVASYLNALSIQSDSPVLHYNLGVAYQEQMRPSQAIEHYKTAIKISPSYAAAYSNLSVALCETGQIEAAESANDMALKLDPNLAESYFNAHAYSLQARQFHLAIESLQKACQIAPHDEKFRFFLGMLLDYTGQETAANRFLVAKSPSRAFVSDLQAWQYLKSLDPRPIMLGHGAAVFEHALGKARPDGLVMEFGVYQGTSIRQIAALTEGTVDGFDSFAGIPEAWNDEVAGSYSTEGNLPAVPQNVALHAGWFEQSIPAFLKTHSAPVRFMNIDCDLYSSTKTVLDLFEAQMGAGTVLVFDEFIGNLSWQQDEFKAFHEAAHQYGWQFEVLCFCFVTKQVAILITGQSEHPNP
jgi:tetratricopeptide (TPR) repeat protein